MDATTNPVASQSFDDFISSMRQNTGTLFKPVPSGIADTRKEKGEIDKNIDKQESITKDLEKFQMPTLDASKLKELPKPIDDEFRTPTDAFKSVLPVFAIFASLATRKPLQTAMTSMASSMDAFHKGDKEQIDLHQQQFKDNMEYALEYNKNALDIHNAILADKTKDWNEKMSIAKSYADLNEQWKLKIALENGDAKGYAEAVKEGNDQLKATIDIYEKWKKSQQSASGTINDETADFVAEQVLAGDSKGLTNFGRGSQASNNLAKIREMVTQKAKERGITGANLAEIDAKFAGLMAESRAEGTRAGNIEISSAAVNGAAKMALDASDKFDRGQYPSLNSVYQAFSKGTGDAAIVDFAVKNNTLINEYAAAQNPRGVPRVSDKDHARELLETAYNKGQYEAGVKAIEAEVANIKKATGDVMGNKTSEQKETKTIGNKTYEKDENGDWYEK